MFKINFIFLEDSFKSDYINLSDDEIKHINDNKYQIVYNLAFESTDYCEYESAIYLQKISKKLIKYILNTPGLELIRENINLDYKLIDFDDLIDNIPYCAGNEYVSVDWIKKILENLLQIYKREVANYKGNIDLYFTEKNKTLIIPSRVFFHLVELSNGDKPFAFMATYTAKQNEKITHYPLRKALKEYANMENEFRELTKSLYKISKKSKFIKKLIESGEIFSPIYLSIDEAYTFLKEINLYEKEGIICRIPNWWNQKSKSTQIEINIDQRREDAFHFFGIGSLVKVSPTMMYQGLEITKRDIENLLIETEGLSLIKGKWIEIDKEKLTNLLEEYEELSKDGTTFSELVNYTRLHSSNNKDIKIEFSYEEWINSIVSKNLSMNLNYDVVSTEFNGKLRPYQFDGYKWLLGMSQFGFGTCLADDMGLGKTIQVLAFLLSYKKYSDKNVLLIVPATLICNWENEIKKFAPTIDYYVARHINSNSLKIKNTFLTITTYQVSQNLNSIYEIDWGIVILDEAQAIKNPDIKTTKKIKSIKRDNSIALTGTPIENNLINLWSIFDFINPGLLGTETDFRKKFDIKSSDKQNIGPLSKIIKPFLLRRLKSDKKIINDLPEKNETIVYTELSKKQIVLYKRLVSELVNKKISSENQFDQKRILLTTILNLKQICNHPSQYLGDEEYNLSDSGKFLLLKEICTTIFEKREKVLIFTQFKEIIEPINKVLKDVFHKEGLVITGDTSLKNREKNIDEFQNGDSPYMILSLKAAGVGLNLTAASNVIHFDRWWNPAVENQATDRAYRIGQKKCVNVYKFTSKNTIEEIIADLMNVKTELFNSTFDSIGINVLNKLSNEELIDAIKYRDDYNE